MPYVPGIVGFVQKHTEDEEVPDDFVRAAMNLLGDLMTAFKNTPTKQVFLNDSLANTITIARSRGSTKSTNTAVKYARAVSSACVFGYFCWY